MDYIEKYFHEATKVLQEIDKKAVESVIEIIMETRKAEGRIFFIGAGGSAANASHAVNDFRKIAGIESYAPTDNVSELTARTNDDGWENVFKEWLKGSRLNKNDLVFVFSVGGGSIEKNISKNIVCALQFTKQIGAKICGIVGRDGGYTAKVADACVIIPPQSAATITPLAESFQAVVWHLLVSHPSVMQHEMKWESIK